MVLLTQNVKVLHGGQSVYIFSKQDKEWMMISTNTVNFSTISSMFLGWKKYVSYCAVISFLLFLLQKCTMVD